MSSAKKQNKKFKKMRFLNDELFLKKNESIKPSWSIKHPVSIKPLGFEKTLKLFVEWKGVPSEKSHKNSEASLPLFVLSPVHCDGIPTVFGESHTTHTDYLWSLHDSLKFTKWRYWDMCGLHHSKFWDVGSRKPCYERICTPPLTRWGE